MSARTTKYTWDFDCPQFVDFAAGLDEFSPSADVHFGEPNERRKKQLLKQMDEFGPRMATPKLKPAKSLKKSPFVTCERPIKTDDEKLAMLSKLPRRESKSDCFLNRIGQKLEYPDKVKELRRRLSDHGFKAKKKLYPATPKCLKRALNKDNSKKPKTTEELEMEQISKLQNELFKRLRLNEINLKRIKENRPPLIMNKFENLAKASNKHAVKGFDGGRLNDQEKKTGLSRFKGVVRQQDRLRDFGKKAEELEAIVNPQLKSTVRPNALREIQHSRLNNIVQDGKINRAVPVIKIDAHSGLKFFPSQDKKTVPHPFSFDTSKSFQNMSLNCTDNTQLSASMRTPQLLINKENIHHTNRLNLENKLEKELKKLVLKTREVKTVENLKG